MRSKREQQRPGSIVVEHRRDKPVDLAAFETAPISRLDTHECDRHTAPYPPFQILLSECADAHPCR